MGSYGHFLEHKRPTQTPRVKKQTKWETENKRMQTEKQQILNITRQVLGRPVCDRGAIPRR